MAVHHMEGRPGQASIERSTDIFPPVDGQTTIELERQRSIPQLIGATFQLYARVPILFLVLAAVIVVPWEFVVLLVTGAGPLAVGHKGFLTNQLISLPDYFIVVPLISALHIHAVREIGQGRRPRLLSTFRQSLPTLPVVVLAAGFTGVATSIGYLALVVPGLLLTARWAVVAQTAAMDGGGWVDAIRRGTSLTDGERWHAFWLIVVAGAIILVPWLVAWHLTGHETTTTGSFAVGTALQILVRSFGALTAALLYFDLKARQSIEPVEPEPDARDASGRAAGWYIDPSNPTRMRYWAADGSGWSKRTTKTPGQMLYEWEEEHATAPPAPAMSPDEHTGHSLDPDVYTDASRPAGWYVDPNQTSIMRYWRTGKHQGWSEETMATPEKARAEWRDVRWRS
jgi:hypothetical protein